MRNRSTVTRRSRLIKNIVTELLSIVMKEQNKQEGRGGEKKGPVQEDDNTVQTHDERSTNTKKKGDGRRVENWAEKLWNN